MKKDKIKEIFKDLETFRDSDWDTVFIMPQEKYDEIKKKYTGAE